MANGTTLSLHVCVCAFFIMKNIFSGWIMKVEVKDTAQYNSLLSSDDYQKYLQDELSVS